MTVKTSVISAAMRELGCTISSADGVANAACFQAAGRLDELQRRVNILNGMLEEAAKQVKEGCIGRDE